MSLWITTGLPWWRNWTARAICMAIWTRVGHVGGFSLAWSKSWREALGMKSITMSLWPWSSPLVVPRRLTTWGFSGREDRTRISFSSLELSWRDWRPCDGFFTATNLKLLFSLNLRKPLYTIPWLPFPMTLLGLKFSVALTTSSYSNSSMVSLNGLFSYKPI